MSVMEIYLPFSRLEVSFPAISSPLHLSLIHKKGSLQVKFKLKDGEGDLINDGQRKKTHTQKEMDKVFN